MIEPNVEKVTSVSYELLEIIESSSLSTVERICALSNVLAHCVGEGYHEFDSLDYALKTFAHSMDHVAKRVIDSEKSVH